jgi:hypothetical protein
VSEAVLACAGGAPVAAEGAAGAADVPLPPPPPQDVMTERMLAAKRKRRRLRDMRLHAGISINEFMRRFCESIPMDGCETGNLVQH